MLDSLLQFVFSMIGGITVSSTPIASAEAISDQMWQEKTPLETQSPISFPDKNALLNMTKKELYWVVAVLDGDTILVSDSSRELFQVRLLAVDTNEINGPDSNAECYGAEATLLQWNS